MRDLGIADVVRGRRTRTTIADPARPVPADLLEWDFTASAPNTGWVADFTEVATWAGKVYGAFGGVDGQTGGVDEGVDRQVANEVSGEAVASAGCRAVVLV